MFNKPVFAPPEGACRTETPDGVFKSDMNDHSLYDTSYPLRQPVIPGDYDNNRDVEPSV